ncbi:MAG: CPBP family intramembrane metalloprotease [Phycisphaerales bacterium]|nr:CPBP family intramembrane metalloprotease [Phycisphaerales bacterium]
MALFFVIAEASAAGLDQLGGGSAMLRQIALKSAMVVVALGLWAATGRHWKEMGWRRPRALGLGRLVAAYSLGALSMGGASIAMILSGARHPAMRDMSLPEIMLGVWIVSSVGEEVFVRGLVQSWIAEGSLGMPRDRRLVVWASAVMFAAMHVPLMWKGAGPVGGAIIVAGTLGLGWGAAMARASGRSLWHAIGVHVFGNAAALAFGVVGVVTFRLIYGHLPGR